MTTFENKINILNIYRIIYGDLEEHQLLNFHIQDALFLSHCLVFNLCTTTKEGREAIELGWEMFLAALEVEDKGFTDLNEILALTPEE